jgi:glucose/arabinose dehydrogenase
MAAVALAPLATVPGAPVAITHAGDGSGRLFITLQAGLVLIHDGFGLRAEPFLDIRPLVSCCAERGLLSVAFHPRYAENGLFFVNYTDVFDDTVVARYAVSAADPDRADPSSAVVLLQIDQPFGNHNGGQLQFGPDGYLYIGMGDGGNAGDPDNQAQNPDSLLGKMLRIDVDGGLPYAIPPDNPFRDTPGVRPEIWALGLRNPWRFSFDRAAGDLFIGDVGQNAWEEVNHQPADSPGGENYGWRLMEGLHCFNPATNCDPGTLTPPIIEYSHTVGCSVTGGYRYRGMGNPELEEAYVFGDLCTGMISAALPDAGGDWSVTPLLDTSLAITSFGESEAGELHVAGLAGGVFRLVHPGPHPVPAAVDVVPPGVLRLTDTPVIRRVIGTGFVPSSVVRWNGADRPTAYISPGELRVVLSGPDIATPGPGTLSVFTPGPGGGSSAGLAVPITVFSDLPAGHFALPFVEALALSGLTAGCGAQQFCPEDIVTRAQVAILLLRGIAGAGALPPAASGTVFGDVPAGAFAAAWIEELFARGLTAGCGGGNYCPERGLDRGEAAVLLLRSRHGAGYQPPAASGIMFADVPADHPFAAWIEQLAAEGITGGCGGRDYCPEAPVTRAQVAVFLVRTFNLPL